MVSGVMGASSSRFGGRLGIVLGRFRGASCGGVVSARAFLFGSWARAHSGKEDPERQSGQGRPSSEHNKFEHLQATYRWVDIRRLFVAVARVLTIRPGSCFGLG